ncbi:MAG: AraC family transcriptional regulator [Planctomycetaceae bacterium]|nr:AraC family transcriptional regulator [Planctomycetaceae bacterium]
MNTHFSLPRDGKRLIYDLTPFGLSEVPYLAAQNLPHIFPGLPTHYHKGCMEINHFLKGERVYRVGGNDFHLRGNQIFVTWPDEVHGSGSFLHDKGTHFWLQLRLPHSGEPFLGLTADCAAPLLDGIWTMPRRQFRADTAMQSLYYRMLQICRNGPSALSRAELTVLLTEWLLRMVRASSQPWEGEITPDINRALELARQNPGAARSVGELADAACLSESHFKLKFKQQLGVPPGDYLLRRRIETGAEYLLRGGMNITDIAYTLEFSSSQHFSTTFKKFFGRSPQAWLRERQGESGQRCFATSKGKGPTPWIEDGVFHGYLCDDER